MKAEEYQELKVLFLALRDVGVAERTRLIEQHSGDDAEKRCELERLLEAHDRRSGALRSWTPVAEAVADTRSASPRGVSSSEIAIPRQLGPVRLLRELGRGGMGTVWLGEDRLLHRGVAVKFLLNAVSGTDDPGFVRFLEGARAAATVQHPSLTLVHAADLFEGVPYVVMEYIDGATLADLIGRHGSVNTPAAVAVLKDVCAAVAELHDQGFVHRDIKPSNVLVDHSGRVCVTDFGLACRRKSGAAAGGPSELAGTPAYMAPEMFDGVVSQRTDVYAIGVMAFQLLTGDAPFRGDWDEIERQHRSVPLPTERLSGQGVEAWLIEIIERSTKKDATFRFKSAQHVLRAMSNACQGSLAQPASKRELADLATLAPIDRTAATSASDSGSSWSERLAVLAAAKSEGKLTGAAPPAKLEEHVSAPVGGLGIHIPCVPCEYDLHGSQPAGKCPECGADVNASLAPDRLLRAPTRWLKRVSLGQGVLFWASVTPLFSIFVPFLAQAGLLGAPGLLEMLLVWFAAPVVAVIGFWLCTSREPPVRAVEPWSARRRARLAAGLVFMVIAGLLVQRNERDGPLWFVLVGSAALLVLAAMSNLQLHLAILARRIPGSRLARGSRVLLAIAILWGVFFRLRCLRPPRLGRSDQRRSRYHDACGLVESAGSRSAAGPLSSRTQARDRRIRRLPSICTLSRPAERDGEARLQTISWLDLEHASAGATCHSTGVEQTPVAVPPRLG